jgi:hypothetical protein
MTTYPSLFAAPYTIPKEAPTLCRAANRGLLYESPFRQSEISGLAAAMPARDLFDEIVEISGSIKRHSTGRYGIVAESVYVPVRARIRIHYDPPVDGVVTGESLDLAPVGLKGCALPCRDGTFGRDPDKSVKSAKYVASIEGCRGRAGRD